MLQITIHDNKVFTKSITTKSGKDITFRTQKAFAHIADKPYPVEINLQLWEAPAFEPGVYSLTELSFMVDKYNNLSLKSSLNLKMDK